MWVRTVPLGLLVQLVLFCSSWLWHEWAAGHKEDIPGPVPVEVCVSGAVGHVLLYVPYRFAELWLCQVGPRSWEELLALCRKGGT